MNTCFRHAYLNSFAELCKFILKEYIPCILYVELHAC